MKTITNSSISTFSAHEKAQQINLDPSFYGTFAEIGAGQEVARWFFRVGGASGTIAKSMSAYDMTFSDAIYGPAERYVSQERLTLMLDHEYQLLQERLAGQRGEKTRFFVFANTVVAKGYTTPKECHAWTGVRFQTQPRGAMNELILHYRLLDTDSLQQQEIIGIMGVNLLYSAYMLWDDLDRLLESIADNAGNNRVEIDMFKMSGENLSKHDNKIASLKMVQKGISKAALFSPKGEILQPSDTFYKRPIILERGYFRPVTKVNIDMMDRAQKRFFEESDDKADPIELFEITMSNLRSKGDVNYEDFLERVDCLGEMNKYVLVSDIGAFYRLQYFLETYTQCMIAIVIGQPLLKEIFKEKYYEDLRGGILESFGRLFKSRLKMYVYPSIDETNKTPLKSKDLDLPAHLTKLHQYLIENEYISDLTSPIEPLPYQPTRALVQKIQRNDNWEELLPEKVVNLIKSREYFGYQNTSPNKRR